MLKIDLPMGKGTLWQKMRTAPARHRSPIGALLACALSVPLFVRPVCASTLEHAKAVNQVMAPWETTYVTIAKRQEVAEKLREYWQSFADRIPRNSPSETQWVKGELASNQNDRVYAMLSRKEYALYILLDQAEDCARNYSRLASDPNLSYAQQAWLWSRTLNCYRDGGGVSVQLLELAAISKRADGPFYIGFSSIWQGWIINSVLPSLLSPPGPQQPSPH